MKLGSYTKQARERESYTIDYRDDLTIGDNLVRVASAVEPAGLTIDEIGIFDPRVRFWAIGGIDGVAYKITITVHTADGRVLEDEVMLKIKEY